MSEIVKIALSGGPCGGKTTALKYLSEHLKPYGVEVICVYEQATALMNMGFSPEKNGSYGFHRQLFENQLSEERKAEKRAQVSSAKKALILCDRGLLDSRAYVTGEEFSKYSALYGFCEDSLRNRYDAVFHLVTAADGAEKDYSAKTNSVRSEDAELARKLDSDILALWVGTQHLRIIDNSSGFENKLKHMLRETLAVLGIPEPLEIERKFLIDFPDIDHLNDMKHCRRIPITQAYMETPEEGIFRVRRRGEGKGALYIKTVKRKINDMKRVETETIISEKEYNDYLSRKDHIEGIISKDRYCIAWKGSYYELDVYPFWTDKATLEIELLSETQPYILPDFIKLIREVTTEKQYRNKVLAVTYAKFFNRG